uniref:Uncharacterized protein n=1 Tax=Ditylenchus dipsaci TaxID=166011 RepID=A0A915E0Z4_9BILA
MPRVNNIDYLLVASADGYLFCYTLDTDGGECTLMRQYRIGPHSVQSEEESMGTAIPISTRSSGPPQLHPTTPGLSDLDNFSKSPSPTQPSIASLRSGGGPPVHHASGGGSSSSSQQSLSQSPPAAAAAAKPVPPPIPPAPRSVAHPSDSIFSTNWTTNPFDMDEPLGLIGGSPSPVKKGGTTTATTKTSQLKKDSDSDGDGLVDISPPADLNDMDEFPPLNHLSEAM